MLENGRSQKKEKKSIRFSALVKPAFKYILVLVILIYFGMTIFNVSSFHTVNNIVGSSRVKFIVDDEIEKLAVISMNGDNDVTAINVYVVNTSKDLKEEILIPSWVYIMEYSGNYDTKISVKDLSYVGENINQEKFHEYIVWQVQNIIASNIDGYVILDDYATKHLTDIKELQNSGSDNNISLSKLVDSSVFPLVLFNSSEIKNLSGHIYSNYSSLELVSKFSDISKAKSEGDIIDLSEEWALLDDSLGNGKKVKVFNYDSIDRKFAQTIEVFRPLDISKEQVKVEVYNGSGVSKAALRYARSIENLGAKVVRTNNAPEDVEKTVFYVPKKSEFQKSIALVDKIFVQEPEIIEGRPNFMTTGDIVIILGSDIQQEVDWN
jgi:hypothetical protein